jgi:hypothetical protein
MVIVVLNIQVFFDMLSYSRRNEHTLAQAALTLSYASNDLQTCNKTRADKNNLPQSETGLHTNSYFQKQTRGVNAELFQNSHRAPNFNILLWDIVYMS